MTGHDREFPAPLVEMRVRRLVLKPRTAEATLASASTPPGAGSEPEDGRSTTRGHDLHQGPKPQPS